MVKIRSVFSFAMNGSEQSFPANFIKTFAIGVPTEPDKNWFSYYVIKGDVPPEARIF